MSKTENIVFRSTEGKDFHDIKLFREPLPEIGSHEILIKIKAVSLNYRDYAIANRSYPFPIKDTVIPCSDSAGEVVKVGLDVKDFSIGDNVINMFDPTNYYGVQKNLNEGYGGPRDGWLQEYKAVKSDCVVKLPSDTHLSSSEAATLVCTGATAWNTLNGGERFTAGQTVLLLGTGGVSITALILARAAGAETIVTSSSDEKLKFVKEKYGVDHTINYKKHPDWEKEVLKITNNEGVDYVIENGGSGTIEKSILCTKRGGNVALVGFLSQAEELPDVCALVFSRSVTLRGIAVGSKQLLEELVRFVHAKKLPMPIEKEFGFTEQEIHSAYNHLGSQSHVGKIAIKMD